MGFWTIALAVFAVSLVAGLLMPRRKKTERQEPEDRAGYEIDGRVADAETLARLGTPDTVADLVAQGRADELRGLGYSGELPPDET